MHKQVDENKRRNKTSTHRTFICRLAGTVNYYPFHDGYSSFAMMRVMISLRNCLR